MGEYSQSKNHETDEVNSRRVFRYTLPIEGGAAVEVTLVPAGAELGVLLLVRGWNKAKTWFRFSRRQP